MRAKEQAAFIELFHKQRPEECVGVMTELVKIIAEGEREKYPK